MQLLTDDDCTRIYNEANGITTKNPPLSTERIFKAMRQAYTQGFAQGAAAQLAERPACWRLRHKDVRDGDWYLVSEARYDSAAGAIGFERGELYTRREAK